MDIPLEVMAGDGRTRTPTEQDLLRERVADLVAQMNRAGWRKLGRDDLGARMTVEYAEPGDVWEVTRGSR